MPREAWQGTLDLVVLQTLGTTEPQHGLGLAKRILHVSEGLLDLNQGTLYPALLRLEQRRWITSRWGISDHDRKAKFYELTARGRRTLDVGTRQRIYARVQQHMAHDLPVIPLWWEDRVVVQSRRLHGFDPAPDGDLHSLAHAWMDGEAERESARATDGPPASR